MLCFNLAGGGGSGTGISPAIHMLNSIHNYKYTEQVLKESNNYKKQV